MSRHKLELDPPQADFFLFGISSQSKDYRLVWIINKKLNLRLQRKEDIVVSETIFFSRFTFEDEINRTKYTLASNKSIGNSKSNSGKVILVKELKTMDYLLIAEGNTGIIDPGDFLSQIKQAETILAAYQHNSEIIKSKTFVTLQLQ